MTTATGPRTEAGKVRSALNATKHGLRSECPILPGEDQAEWEALRADVFAVFEPATLLEEELAERIALQQWRLRRVTRYEVQIAGDEAAQEPAAMGLNPHDPRPAPRQHRLLNDKALDRVIRYEAHISRQLRQAQQLLEQFQAVRLARESGPIAPERAPAPQATPATAAGSFGNSSSATPPAGGSSIGNPTAAAQTNDQRGAASCKLAAAQERFVRQNLVVPPEPSLVAAAANRSP